MLRRRAICYIIYDTENKKGGKGFGVENDTYK